MNVRKLKSVVLAMSLLLGGMGTIGGASRAQAQGSAYSNEMAAGRQAFEGSSFALAERHFQGAIDVAGSDTQKATAWYSLGVVAQKQGRADDARQRAEKALALAPNHNQAKALLEEIARTPVKAAKAGPGPVTGATARAATADVPKKSPGGAAAVPTAVVTEPASPAPREARPKSATNLSPFDERKQAFEAGDCDRVKALDTRLRGSARHPACLETQRTKAVASGDCERVKTLDAEIGGEARHDACQAEAAKLKAEAVVRERITQRTAALGDLECDKVGALDAEIGTDPQHGACVASAAEKKSSDERLKLSAQRMASFLALKCDEVQTLDGQLSEASLHEGCLFNSTLRSGTPRELFLAGVRHISGGNRDFAKARLLLGAVVDRHGNDDLAIKAAEQLAAIANAEAIEASNARAVDAARHVQGLAERTSAERASAPAKEFCYTKNACSRNCPQPKTESGAGCLADCAAAYARCK